MPTATFTRLKRMVHCTLRTSRGLFFGNGANHERALRVAKEQHERSKDSAPSHPSRRIPGWGRNIHP